MPEPLIQRRGEVWAKIPGHRGYWVSSHGRIRSRRGVLKPFPGDKSGHLAVALRGRRHVLVHRVVATAFVLNPDAGRFWLVRHLDGDPAHNAADNLAWGDSSMNSADAQRHGTVPVGRPRAARLRDRYANDPNYRAKVRALSRERRARARLHSPKESA